MKRFASLILSSISVSGKNEPWIIHYDLFNYVVGTVKKKGHGKIVRSMHYAIYMMGICKFISGDSKWGLDCSTPGANFDLPCTPPRTIFHGCQIVHWDPRNAKNFCPQR